MQSLNVLIANADSNVAAMLASTLYPHFRSVAVTNSREELLSAIAKNRAELAVIDLETFSMAEVERLHDEFGATAIVCTHRVADEEMWAQALAAGAIDCCDPNDANTIVQAVERNVPLARSTAA